MTDAWAFLQHHPWLSLVFLTSALVVYVVRNRLKAESDRFDRETRATLERVTKRNPTSHLLSTVKELSEP